VITQLFIKTVDLVVHGVVMFACKTFHSSEALTISVGFTVYCLTYIPSNASADHLEYLILNLLTVTYFYLVTDINWNSLFGHPLSFVNISNLYINCQFQFLQITL